MASRRKSVAERSAERWQRENECWQAFRPRLVALNTLQDALALVGGMPPPDHPCRHHYTNLQFFIDSSFRWPGGSTPEERVLYVDFVSRLEQSGQVSPGTAEQVRNRGTG